MTKYNAERNARFAVVTSTSMYPTYLPVPGEKRLESYQAAKETLSSHGFGLSSVRFICGTQDGGRWHCWYTHRNKSTSTILPWLCVHQDVHKQLEAGRFPEWSKWYCRFVPWICEAAISKFHGTEDTILFPSCFDANAGLFEAMQNTGKTRFWYFWCIKNRCKNIPKNESFAFARQKFQ